MFPGGTSISGGWVGGGGLGHKGEKYPKLCPLNFRYDPKICVEDLHEFSSALYYLVRFKVTSKQII